MATKSKPRPRLTKARVRAAIQGNFGVIAEAARELKCTRAGLHKAIHRHGLESVVEAARQLLVEEAEGHLARAVRQGRAWAVKFVLATIGRQRFKTAQEVDVKPKDKPCYLVPDKSPETLAKLPKESGWLLVIPDHEDKPQ